MIKIFLPEINSKFYNNIRHLSDNLLEVHSYAPIDIYKIHNRISANAYIFDSSYVSSEIVQFINEYSELPTKTFIYHRNSHLNKDMIRYIKKSNHIISHNLFDEFSKYKNTIQLPEHIINEKIFYRTNFKERIDREVYLLDNDKEIPKYISDRLLPNKKDSKTILFNNSSIPHAQNLGILTEMDKAKILNEYKYYVCDEHAEYMTEAFSCGCVILDKNFSEIQFDNSDIQTFSQFVKKIL